MKKLMVAFAAIAMAVGAQAAAVTWSSGQFLDHTGTAVAKGAAGYAATVHFFTYNSTLGEYVDADTTFGGGPFSTTTVGKGPTMKGDTATSGIDTGTYYAQMTIVNGDWTLTSEIAQFNYNSASLSPQTINFTTGEGFATVSAKFDQTGANAGWQSVPEPTSGLLLLIGMAGLALRRRRA